MKKTSNKHPSTNQSINQSLNQSIVPGPLPPPPPPSRPIYPFSAYSVRSSTALVRHGKRATRLATWACCIIRMTICSSSTIQSRPRLHPTLRLSPLPLSFSTSVRVKFCLALEGPIGTTKLLRRLFYTKTCHLSLLYSFDGYMPDQR